jgi:hypothetical protein
MVARCRPSELHAKRQAVASPEDRLADSILVKEPGVREIAMHNQRDDEGRFTATACAAFKLTDATCL